MISDALLQDWVKDTDAANLATLRATEQAAIAAIQKRTGRYLGIAAAAVTEIIRFRGWPFQLANEPTGGVITSVEQWDGSAYSLLAATDYYLSGTFIWPNATSTPPTTTAAAASQRFRVIYPAGYAGAGDVWAAPSDIQQAVKILTAHWYENREAAVVGTISAEVELGLNWLLEGQTAVSV